MAERSEAAGSAAEPAVPAWQSRSRWSAIGDSDLDLWRIDLTRPPLRADLLDTEEQRRAARLLLAEKRRQFANARSALRELLSGYLDIAPEALRFAYGRHGRPELVGSDLAFNLSHSGELAVVAVSGRPRRLGVDVEVTDAGRPLERLAARFFAPAEAEQLAGLRGTALTAAFYRGWTRKEAYLKAWGTGLTFSSRRFRLDLTAIGGGRLLLGTEMPDDEPQQWWFEDYRPGIGYTGAVCWRGGRLRLRRFDAFD